MVLQSLVWISTKQHTKEAKAIVLPTYQAMAQRKLKVYCLVQLKGTDKWPKCVNVPFWTWKNPILWWCYRAPLHDLNRTCIIKLCFKTTATSTCCCLVRKPWYCDLESFYIAHCCSYKHNVSKCISAIFFAFYAVKGINADKQNCLRINRKPAFSLNGAQANLHLSSVKV